MSLRAYHQLILPDGSVQTMVVVRFADDGSFVDYHQLRAEEPFVIWVGGTLDLCKIEI